MDNIETLFNKKQYQAVIKVCRNSSNINSLFFCLYSYINLKLFDDAIIFIKEKNEILIQDRKRLFNAHMDILFEQKNYIKALEMLDFYDSLPYLDYEFEEMLKDTKKHILKNLEYHQKAKTLNDEDIKELLRNPCDNGTMLFMIDNLRKIDITPFIEDIKYFLSGDYNDMIQTYLLLVLVDKKYQGEVTINKNKVTMECVPYELDAPFENHYHKEFLNLLNDLSFNPSVYKTACEIFNQYVLVLYPMNIFDDEATLNAVSIICLACKYLNEESMIEEYCKKYDFKEDIVINLMEEIEYMINTFLKVEL
ncbi:MAG: hypothetical protein HUJ61_07870 [Bacilli bacterium]|nr:hypothetical protein [Bacilli bacterium]